MTRHDGRAPDQLRDVRITRNWLDHAEGSVLVEFGRTRVLCAASFTEGVPRWRKGSGEGWVTAEYAMLPRATNTRSDRESVKGRIGGRTHEISRLIGRCLRAVIDTKALGENTIVLDCDVLQADGGTRTAAITGAYVALADADRAGPRGKELIKATAQPLTGSVAAVCVGIVDGVPVLDLGYAEDVDRRDRHERRDDRRRQLRRGAGHRRGRAVRPRALLDALLDLATDRLRRADPAASRTALAARDAAVSRVVLATRNAHKVARAARDPRRRRSPTSGSRSSASTSSRTSPDVVETGVTFAENALLKARAAAAGHRAARASPTTPGWPSTCSAARPACSRARWSGRHGDDARQPRAAARPARRRARRAPRRGVRLRRRRWPCPDGRTRVREGRLPGRVARAPRGTGGFGYDPIFAGRTATARTAAELTPAEKNAISPPRPGLPGARPRPAGGASRRQDHVTSPAAPGRQAAVTGWPREPTAAVRP